MESGINIQVEGNDLASVDVIFGGRIGVTYGQTNKESIVILHQLDRLYPEGQIPEGSKESFRDHFHVSLVFDNIKSIEVIEKVLKDAKNFLSQREKY